METLNDEYVSPDSTMFIGPQDCGCPWSLTVGSENQNPVPRDDE